jgi:hypothetical protein
LGVGHRYEACFALRMFVPYTCGFSPAFRLALFRCGLVMVALFPVVSFPDLLVAAMVIIWRPRSERKVKRKGRKSATIKAFNHVINAFPRA